MPRQVIIDDTPYNTPELDIYPNEIADYKEQLRREYHMGNDALFAENREWCENYWCVYYDKYKVGWKATLASYVAKAIDKLTEMLLDMVYSLLDVLTSLIVSTLGTAAKMIDTVVRFACLLTVFVANLFGAKMKYGSSCCMTGGELFSLILEFLKIIYEGVTSLYKAFLRVWYKILSMYERMTYTCECQRIYQDTYKEIVDAKKLQYGNRYSDYVVVVEDTGKFNLGDVEQVSTKEEPSPDPGKAPVLYIIVKRTKPAVSPNFKRHVDYTITAFSKWPYNTEGYCWAKSATYAVSFVTWMGYAQLLCSMWLSTSNMASPDNPTGYTREQREEMLRYCREEMPPKLWFYVYQRVSSAEDPQDLLEEMEKKYG